MRTLSVLTLKKCDEKFLNDPDMSGPLLLGFMLGIFLMLVIIIINNKKNKEIIIIFI